MVILRAYLPRKLRVFCGEKTCRPQHKREESAAKLWEDLVFRLPDAHEQTKGERENARHGRFLQIGRKTVYLHRQYPACDRQPVRPGTKPTDKTGRNAQAGPEQHTDDAQHHCDTSRDRGGFHTSPRSDKSCFPGYRRKQSYRAPSRRKAETVRRIYSGTFLSSRDS